MNRKSILIGLLLTLAIWGLTLIAVMGVKFLVAPWVAERLARRPLSSE